MDHAVCRLITINAEPAPRRGAAAHIGVVDRTPILEEGIRSLRICGTNRPEQGTIARQRQTRQLIQKVSNNEAEFEENNMHGVLNWRERLPVPAAPLSRTSIWGILDINVNESRVRSL